MIAITNNNKIWLWSAAAISFIAGFIFVMNDNAVYPARHTCWGGIST